MAKVCFVIAPIGKDKSPTRERSDRILRHVIKPVCRETGYDAHRADEVPQPGTITRRIVRDLLTADLVIADLSEQNANVFYELAIRHFTGLPVIQIINLSDTLPFDVFDVRTIRIDHTDLDSVEQAKMALRSFIKALGKDPVCSTPLTDEVRALGIALPLLGGPPKPIAEQVQDVLHELLAEFRVMKGEREQLLQGLVDATQNREPAGKLPRGTVPVTGLWRGQYGLVKLAASGDRLFGSYQFDTYEWVGELEGRLMGQTLVANWRNAHLTGIACWSVLDACRLDGKWWFSGETPPYDKLISAPASVKRILKEPGEDWDLVRV